MVWWKHYYCPVTVRDNPSEGDLTLVCELQRSPTKRKKSVQTWRNVPQRKVGIVNPFDRTPTKKCGRRFP